MLLLLPEPTHAASDHCQTYPQSAAGDPCEPVGKVTPMGAGTTSVAKAPTGAGDSFRHIMDLWAKWHLLEQAVASDTFLNTADRSQEIYAHQQTC